MKSSLPAGGEQGKHIVPILGNSISFSLRISKQIRQRDTYCLVFDDSVRLWAREDIAKGVKFFSLLSKSKISE